MTVFNDISGNKMKRRRLNAFSTDDSIGLSDWQVLLGVVLLVPVRIVFCTLVCVGYVLTLIAATPKQGLDKPLPEYAVARQLKITKVYARLMCFGFGIYRMPVAGKLASYKEAKMIVAAPHSTMMDGFVLASVAGGTTLAKAELRNAPLFRQVGKYLQILFVDRGDAGSRGDIAAAIKERGDLNSSWRSQLTLFPEGTCTNKSSLIEFKRGAFAPGVPVQPVLLSWQTGRLDPSWTAGARSRTMIFIRTLATFQHSVKVTFLPPYVPNKAEKKDSNLFAKNMNSIMASALGIPSSDFGFVDMLLARTCAKKLSPELLLPFSFKSFTKELGIKDEEASSTKLLKLVQSLLLCFSECKSPFLTEAMYNSIAVKSAGVTKISDPIAWESLEKNEHGSLSFRQFLKSYVIAAKHTTTMAER